MAFGGKGIGYRETELGRMVIFVQNTIPGQRVRAKVDKSKRKYAECKLVEVLERSDREQEVSYQPIPGAPYITLPLNDQVKFKKSNTFDLFRKIGGVEDIEERFDSYIKSPQTWHYRNKMEYSFSAIRFDLESKEMVDDFGLGFKHRGTWWAVENLDSDSGIFDKQVEDALIQIRKWCEASGLPAWHPPRKEGFFRHLVVRKSYFNQQLLFNLVTTDDFLDQFDTPGFIRLMKELFGNRLAGLVHTINNNTGDRVEPTKGNTNLIYGEQKVIEMINGLEFEISIQSFFQTNPKCAELLYDRVVDYAGQEHEEDKIIMDLFCGTGTISQLLAKGTGKNVVGVDIVESAIEDAKANAKRNRVNKVKFFASDVGKFLLKYPDYEGKIGTIVLDPPRAGIAPKTLKKVIHLGAKRLVYVSCNPATQARDTEQLREAGYELVKFSMVDQFPHTSHIETVALFEKS